MKTLSKIVFLLMCAAFFVVPSKAQPSNPSNYCSWMQQLLGAGKYFKNDTLMACSGSIIGGGLSFTLPNMTYKLDNGFTTYTSDSSGKIILPSIPSPGLHWFDITKDGCTARDSFYLQYVTPPKVNLGNDTTLCLGDSLVLDAGNTGASFTWNNNFNPNQPQTFVVRDPGKYRVRVTIAGCASSDTIEVSYAEPPQFSLGPDKLLCEGDSVMLYPGYVNAKYLWQDGSTKPALIVSAAGTYSVRMDHACGTFYDTVNFKSIQCKFYVPNAFTPNNDGKNDVFKVLGYDTFSFFRFSVYNRFGSVIFSSSLPEKGWDGTFKGNLLPAGVYVWILEYKNKYKQERSLQKGTVVLIR